MNNKRQAPPSLKFNRKRQYSFPLPSNIPNFMDVFTHQPGNSFRRNDISTPPPPAPVQIAYSPIPIPAYRMYPEQWTFNNNWATQQLPPLPKDSPEIPPPPPPEVPDTSENLSSLINVKSFASVQNIPGTSKRAKKRQKQKAAAMNKARKTMQEWNKKDQKPIIIIKFPDPHIDSDVVKKFHHQINMVHFQQPCTPRHCFAQLNPNADIDAVIEEISKIKFGDGYLSAERKHLLSSKEKPHNVDDKIIDLKSNGEQEHENENGRRIYEEILESKETNNQETNNGSRFSLDVVKQEPRDDFEVMLDYSVMNIKQESLEDEEANDQDDDEDDEYDDDDDDDEDLENSQSKITEYILNNTWDKEKPNEELKPKLLQAVSETCIKSEKDAFNWQ